MKIQVKFVILGALCISWNVAVRAQSGPIVTTKQGDVLGTYKESVKGREFAAFLGIPYAKPPLGDLRFAAPVAADPWTPEVFNGTQDAPVCYQIMILYDKGFKGQEDCLTLNVYTPKLPSSNSTLLPVIVFVYGGAFIFGEDSFGAYGPERHMDHDLVLVAMNYRLGPFGFLSTYDGAAPGNFGLMDQLLALQWIRDNIASFGGNPNDVTLTGESAGSDSVTSHILSPMSTGLFHRVIAESGNPLTPWGIVENPRYYADKLAAMLNCSSDDSYELVNCLRQQDMEAIYDDGLSITGLELILAFVPVVENPNEDHLFLWEDPLTLLQEGRFNKVPLISGYNRDEGCLIYYVAEPLGIFNNINDIFFDVNVPALLRILTDYRQNLINVSYAIKDLYYSNIDLSDQTIVTRTNIDLLSDMFMIPYIYKFNHLVASSGVPVYTYEFDYNGNFSFSYFTGEADDIHGEELVYLFNFTVGSNNIALNEKDTAFSDMFLGLWTNFTIYGNPTPADSDYIWKPMTANSSLYLSIDEELAMLSDYQTERMEFWLNEVPKIVNGTI